MFEYAYVNMQRWILRIP